MMTRVIDCFLFHDEIELLEVRLEYLADTANRFVIVTSSQAFSGRPKQCLRLENNPKVTNFLDRIDLVHLDTLTGDGPWQREAYSRNAISQGLAGCQGDDLVVLSDIDELPRKSVLRAIRDDVFGRGPMVLGLDYFNFKFNYKQVHGNHAIWAGPVVCRYNDFTSAQEMRAGRWAMFDTEGQCIEDAGWHFSYLTSTGDLSGKLKSFSHQDPAVQRRGDLSVGELIECREGFHDHLHAGSVWAIVELDSFGCADLANHVQGYPRLLVPQPADADDVIEKRVRRSVQKIYSLERKKVLSNCSGREIVTEVFQRLKRRLS